jgi:hypothetical protein
MNKLHIIDLTLNNNTSSTLKFSSAFFHAGTIAEGSSWPTSIAPNSVAKVQCCESDSSSLGCSGWANYEIDNCPLYFCFSNPEGSRGNGIDIGNQPGVWDEMKEHYYPISRSVQVSDSIWIVATISSSAGIDNQAIWDIGMCDVDTIYPSNLELRNVQKLHANFPTSGSRKYYQCDIAPTTVPGLVTSHFKGISKFSNKLIFTHTNLAAQQTNGKYLIADRVISGDQASVDDTLNTLYNGWRHPCSSQACGSFMAMGIQQDETGPGAQASEIQILDIRMSQVNQPITLIGSIKRLTDGINGVGITKEAGVDGRYIVAGVNGSNLTIYRSTTSSLMDGDIEFNQVLYTDQFPDSGAGLALVTQEEDGAIFLFALNADDSGANNQMNLYKLDLQSPQPTYSQVSVKNMKIPGMSDSLTIVGDYLKSASPLLFKLFSEVAAPIMNSSFRWGKGLAITSSETIEVYASDRNELSLLKISAIGCKDFSLVVWTNEIK